MLVQTVHLKQQQRQQQQRQNPATSCHSYCISTTFVAHPSWSFEEPQQSDRISPKKPLQGLSRQWSFLVLIIVTQSSQVYQQTRPLGYSESGTTRHGLLWKKENEIMLHLSSKNFTGYLWNSATTIRSRLWSIAISKSLYLRSFLYLSALMNHPGLSDLPKKSYSKSPSETWNLLGNVLFVSWRRLFGTRYQPISEICQHYLSSNLPSKPSCSPRLSRTSSTPDYRLCICICFVCF